MEKKKQKSKQEWLNLIKKGEAYCYIKPNMKRHDSGYRCFEVGYLLTTDDSRRCREKLVLNQYSDHIQLYNYDFTKSPLMTSGIMPNMDLLLDGYIRIFEFDRKKKLWWGSVDFVVSSAQLEIIEV